MSTQLDPEIEAEQRYAEDVEFRVVVALVSALMRQFPRLENTGDIRQALLVIERQGRAAKIPKGGAA